MRPSRQRWRLRRAVAALAAAAVAVLASGCSAETADQPREQLAAELDRYAHSWQEAAPWPELPTGSRLAGLALDRDRFAYRMTFYLPTAGGHFWSQLCVARAAMVAEDACGGGEPAAMHGTWAKVIMSERPTEVERLPMVESADSLQVAALARAKPLSLEWLARRSTPSQTFLDGPSGITD